MSRFLKEFEGAAKFAKVDVDGDGKKIADEYNIKSIPCIIVFKSGKCQGRITGARTKEELRIFIREHAVGE
jgi:thioredoxin-like negative regulator of GroEL